MTETTRHTDRFSWGAVVALAGLGAHSLAGRLPEGHDTLLHFYRIPALSALWRQGIVYSRWLPDLMLGYGYPLLNYYPPLSTYLLTVLYWLVGQHAPLATALAFALTIGLAAVGMFVLGRGLYGRAGGLLAAAGYVLSPHLLYQTYERGSLSNAWAMALFPWALHTLLALARRPTARRAAWAALAWAGILLSHAAASLVFAPALGIMGLAGAWVAGRRRLRRAAAVAVALGLGLALAAFFWAPALGEVGMVHYGTSIASPDVHWSLHFADALAWPPLAVDGLANPALPLSVGLGQAALGLVGGLVALGRVVAARRARRAPALETVVTLAAAVIGGGALFLASPGSAWVWERVGVLHLLQFPWRCLDPAALLLALAAGGAMRPSRPSPLSQSAGRGGEEGAQRGAGSLWYGGAGRAAHVALLPLAILVFVGNALPYLYPPRHGGLPERPTLADASAYQATYGAYGLTSWGEYLPADVPEPPAAPAFPGADEAAPLSAKLRERGLPGRVLSAEGNALRAVWELSTDAAGAATLSTYWFTGWRAEVDGQPVPTRPDAEGLLTVDVPAGAHRLAVRWGTTPLRAAAEAASLAGLAGVLVLVLGPWGRLRQRAAARHAPPAEGAASRGAGEQAVLLAMCAALVLALSTKALVLDRVETPLVRRVTEGALSGCEQPPWRQAGEALSLAGYRLRGAQEIELYWVATAAPAEDYVVELVVEDMTGATVARVPHTHPGLSLTSRWAPGRLVRDAYDLPVAPGETPMAYRLFATVYAPGSDGAIPIADAPDAGVTEIPVGLVRLPAAPQPMLASAAPVGAEFGGVVALDGVLLPPAVVRGQPLEYTFLWRALDETDVDYTVFLHLIDGDGQMATGQDAQPRGGLYPTSVWAPREQVADERSWVPGLAPGRYRVEVGLYDLSTMARLPLTGGDTALGDRVALGEIEITP